MGLRKFKQPLPTPAPQPAALLAPSALQHALDNGDANVRRQAIWQADLSDQAVQLLLTHLHTEADERVLEALFVALTRCANPAVVEPMLQQLGSESASRRNRVQEVLCAYPQHVLERAPALLATAEADVRILFIHLMTDLRHPGVPACLQHVLAHEAHVNVVAAALEVLAEVGDASALPALAQVQQRFAHEPFIGFAAQVAQQRIGVQ